MKTTVLIIGAGPAGTSCGIRLMKAGIRCLLVDRMSFPREKLCAGLFTQQSQDALRALLGDKEFEACMKVSVCSREDSLRLYENPHQLMVQCKPKDPITIIDRQEFDQWLVNNYVGLGGEFRDNSHFETIDFVGQKATFSTFEVEYDYLIAADGANSTVEHMLADVCPDTFARKQRSSLRQVINVDRSDLDIDGINIYFNVVPNSYAWVFAKGDKTSIGLVKLQNERFDTDAYMHKFLNDIGLKNAEKYPLQGAMIPVGAYMERPVHWTTLFVGDAAGLVEPLTCEGIYYAIQSGMDAADAIGGKGNTSNIYMSKVSHLTALIDRSQKYQAWFEDTKLRKLFFAHAHRHPNFIQHFIDTQIEHGSLDSFWKVAAKYLCQGKHHFKFMSVLMVLMISLSAQAQIAVDSTVVQPISWREAQQKKAYEWHITKQARILADTIVYYQLPSGGWCKNQDWWVNPDTTYLEECKRTGIGSTIDNGATVAELEYLAKMYYYTNIIAYRVSFMAGMEYLLGMQYDNGGWPQYYPARSEGHYSSHITFNDNAMLRVMRFLHDVSENVEPYDMLFLHQELRDRCIKAYSKGIECILKCQIQTDNGPAVWCQQHDEYTLQPAQGRAYEPPSFCGTAETCEIIRELLAQPTPSEEIIFAIDGAIRWLENHKITGKRIEHFTNSEGKRDIRLVSDPSAPALWARMYDLITGEPIFCGRDGVAHSSIDDIEYERRNGYNWLSTDPQKLIDEFPAWEERVLMNYMAE